MTALVRRLAARLGIRSRILLLVLAIGSVFAGYLWISTARQAERDGAQARERLRLVAALSGARLDDHVGDLKQFLRTLSETLPDDLTDVDHNDRTLRRLSARLPANAVDIALWAPDGANIGSSEQIAPMPRPVAATRPFFTAARRDAEIAMEAPVRLAKGGEWTGVFAVQVVRDHRVVAVVSVSTRLATLTRTLDPDDALPDGAIVTIANTDATIVARSREAERFIGQAAPVDRTTLLRRFAAGQGDAESAGLDGVSRLLGFARARNVPWLVYVGLPTDAALAAVSENRRDGLVLGGVMLLVIALLALWVSSRITLPLRALGLDARRIGEGRLDHRSRVRTTGEVGVLAATLNRMAEALQERIAAARRQEERLTLALEGSEQSLFDWDVANNRIHYNARASVMRGGPEVEQEVTPEAMQAFVHDDDLPDVLAALRAALRGDVPLYEAEFRVLHRDGNWIWLRSRGRVVERDASGRALRLVGTDADISRRKAAEAELRQRAERDVLTGLPNRALFFDRLDGAVARARRSGKPMALLYLDVDRFKSINDLHGHAAGDALLQTTAERLLAAVRGTDTVARLSGDEFTVILENLVERVDAAGVAEKLVDAMRVPIVLAGGGTVSVSTSVGIAVLEPADLDGAALLRRADDALYDAKRGGRDRYAVSRVLAG